MGITGDATVSGNGTNVNIDFGPTWNNGTVCVAAQTSCFTSPAKCISISKSAGLPNNLSGNFTACPNTNQTYSVTPLHRVPQFITGHYQMVPRIIKQQCNKRCLW